MRKLFDEKIRYDIFILKNGFIIIVKNVIQYDKKLKISIISAVFLLYFLILNLFLYFHIIF